ncbi:MAG: hypothetical protein FJZ43_03555 [Candidatus Staskawiczbacteria bacterium]|nr:hypothetical protein [Candidatus Staskawiczbacteria bacterium]
MERFLPKFNLYEQLAHLMVGAETILSLELIWFVYQNNFISLNISIFIWILLAYFTGHFIQAVYSIFFKENKSNFTDSERTILAKARKLFSVKSFSDGEIYKLCYMSSLANDITNHVGLFNAYYSLFRGWFISGLIFSMVSIVLLIITNNLMFILLMTGFAVFSVVFFKRKNRFFIYSKEKTLQTFLINLNNKTKSKT